MPLRPYDEALLRRSFAIALKAREGGDHPFGCLLADAEGNEGLGGDERCCTSTTITSTAITSTTTTTDALPASSSCWTTAS